MYVIRILIRFPIDLLWGVGFLVSATISAISALYSVLKNYIIDVVKSVSLAAHLNHPIAPEAFGVSDAQFALLGGLASHHLRRYAQHGTAQVNMCDFLHAARILTVASALSYADEQETQMKLNALVLHWNARVLYSSTRSDKHAQATLLIQTPGESSPDRPVIIVAFRGTELPDQHKETWREFYPDWIRNFRFCMRVIPGVGAVTSGFYKAWSNGSPNDGSLRDKVVAAIRECSECSGNLVDVFITGHSAGGALAGVSLLDLINRQHEGHFQIRGCITLAQPRYCDAQYSRILHQGMQTNNSPLDMLVNVDDFGADAITGLGGPWTTEPPGRLWQVSVGKPITAPVGDNLRRWITRPSWPALLRRIALCLPLHWPGGRVGYLSALGA